MECPICFGVISNSCYASCSHHFCYKCLKKWCNKGGITCPMCKDRMYQIILDKEFDLKNNPKNKEKLEKEYTKTIYVNFDDKIEPGITVRERTLSKNEVSPKGVLVTNLGKDKKLKGFLKIGDIILYLNGVPCINSKNSIDVINYYYKTEGMLKIEIEDEKNKTRFCCTDIFFKKRINVVN